MKKSFKILLFALVAIPFIISGCKKGENDPALSLKSRTSRLAGDWKLTAGTFVTTTKSGSTVTTNTTTFTESTKVESNSSSSSTNTFNHELTMTFEKKGSFTQKIVETQITAGGTAIPSAFQTTDTEETKGTWAFIGKNKDMEQKKKEGIVYTLNSSTVTSVSSGGTTVSNNTANGWFMMAGGVYMIDRLKNKELVFKGTYGTASGNNSSTYDYDLTFTAQ